MKNAIQLAVKGGYRPFKTIEINGDGQWVKTDFERWGYVPPGLDNSVATLNIYKSLLDPLFWSALGKSLELDGSTYRWQKEGEEKWLTLWIRFTYHLAEGKDPESFFNTLLQ